MANVVELESDANITEEQQVSNTSPEEMKKQNFDNAIYRIMKKSYILGLSNGVRSAFIAVLLEINKDSKMNATERLLQIKNMCEKRIDELKSSEASESASAKGMKIEGENNEA